PRPAVVAVEDTHMPANGAVWSVDRLRDVAAIGLPVHLDGARLCNAEVASGVVAADIAAHATTVMCCLSKGLGAPIGSMLAGPAEVMAGGPPGGGRAGAREGEAGGASDSAAGCGRRTSSPPPGSSRSARWSTGWPTTTGGPTSWPRRSPTA